MSDKDGGRFMLAIVITGQACAQETEHIKWYGFGGELYDPYRWLGRIGITEYVGAEVLFGIEHLSEECEDDEGDCDYTRLDVGAGFIFDFAPEAKITPYLGGRFILTMTGNGESETAGTVEAATGVEYIILKRLGLTDGVLSCRGVEHEQHFVGRAGKPVKGDGIGP